LPTRTGLLFAGVLLAMLAGSINYSLNLGFALTFLLAGLGLVSILHTHRNLSGLILSPGRVDPVFAGQQARFSVSLESHSRYERLAIGLRRKDGPAVFCDVPADGAAAMVLGVPAARRGRLKAGPFSLFTLFPLGLFRAWANIELDMSCLVYPRPEAGEITLPPLQPIAGEGPGQGIGREDFSTLRPYRPGDSPRHIAWKALARGHGVLTKQFSGMARGELSLDWESLAGMETEPRLSRLCRWVLDAHAAGMRFGLRLPGKSIAPGQDEGHLRQCLEALALFAAAP
jgi:uncharacterized protein (DUF58 family)